MLALLRAVAERLQQAVERPVFNDVPEDHPFPYVTFGDETTDLEWLLGKLIAGRDLTVTINFWSQYSGMQEVLQLMGQASKALTTTDLVLDDNFRLVILTVESMTTVRLQDGKTRQGIMRLRARVQDELIQVR
jgi:hypothetical protein